MASTESPRKSSAKPTAMHASIASRLRGTASSDSSCLSKNELKFIHVGGTNGKGSTSSFISSILKESNYKVGTFTSPHFFDFRERIRINNNKIQKSYITSFIKENKILIEDLGLSFFELLF